MEDEHEGTGVVKNTWPTSCKIAATINGKRVNLSFKPNIFYSRGIPFEGNIMEVLQKGTQVQFSFAFEPAKDGFVPKLLAVWVGDKPNLLSKREVLYRDPPLEGVLGPERRSLFSIKREFRFSKIYLEYDNNFIHVNLNNLYDSDGQRCTGECHFEDFAGPGKTVNFEAIPTADPDLKFPLYSRDKKFTHEALCVWVGEKPSLKAVASFLPRPDGFLLKTQGFLYGTVAKLYLPDIALVVSLPGNKTVCVHSDEFDTDGQHLITDFLGLGDAVKFRVVYDKSCPIFTRAVDVSIVDESELRKPEGGSKEKSSFLLSRTPLCGSVSCSKGGIAVLSYKDHKVLVSIHDFYFNGALCSQKTFNSVVMPDTEVNFEAVSFEAFVLQTQIDFRATRAWIGEKPSLALISSSVGEQGPMIAEMLLSYDDKIFLGIVSKICLPRVALIQVKLGNRIAVVDVSVSAFSDDKRKPITDFVDFGYVQFKVKQSDCLFGVCAYDVEALTEREFMTYVRSLNRWQKAFGMRLIM